MAVKMVPTMSVVVIRDGKRVKPEIGKTFPFTTEERDAILEADPKALRKPTDESPSDEADAADSAPPSAEKAQAAAKGGKKAATAAKSDDEAAKDDDL